MYTSYLPCSYKSSPPDVDCIRYTYLNNNYISKMSIATDNILYMCVYMCVRAFTQILQVVQ